MNSNPDIIVQKADKISAFVILGKKYYNDKLIMEDHLSKDTYRKVDTNSDQKTYIN